MTEKQTDEVIDALRTTATILLVIALCQVLSCARDCGDRIRNSLSTRTSEAQ